MILKISTQSVLSSLTRHLLELPLVLIPCDPGVWNSPSGAAESDRAAYINTVIAQISQKHRRLQNCTVWDKGGLGQGSLHMMFHIHWISLIKKDQKHLWEIDASSGSHGALSIRLHVRLIKQLSDLRATRFAIVTEVWIDCGLYFFHCRLRPGMFELQPLELCHSVPLLVLMTYSAFHGLNWYFRVSCWEFYKYSVKFI